jgi:hypothetical protein
MKSICFPPAAFCLLPTALCLLPTAFEGGSSRRNSCPVPQSTT